MNELPGPIAHLVAVFGPIMSKFFQNTVGFPLSDPWNEQVIGAVIFYSLFIDPDPRRLPMIFGLIQQLRRAGASFVDAKSLAKSVFGGGQPSGFTGREWDGSGNYEEYPGRGSPSPLSL